MEEKKNNKKFIIVLIGIIGVCLIALGITYAYWILTREQTGENVVNTACLNITFTGENDITLDKAYPLQPAELEKFLSTATPYHFTIHNECSDLASAAINLESLNVTGKALEDDYIDLILYEDDYNTNLNTYKKLTGNTPNDENKVITDSKHAYSLYNFTLKSNEEKDFNLLLYMDPDTPMVDANMNASWKGKITLSAGYKEENTTIREISFDDDQGMWGYKDKLTKIVIETKKSIKTGEEVHGPFDESADGYGGVQSYVVCDTNDENCIGYLQGTNGIKANDNSKYLFAYFSNITEIKGLENLDTSNVTDMSNMFNGLSHITELNLSNFVTSNVTDMYQMFANCTNLSNIDMSNFNTPKLNSITNMFYNCTSLETLDLSSFDNSNLSGDIAFARGCTSLRSLNLSNWKFNSNIYNRIIFSTGIEQNLEELILKNVDTSQMTDMNFMFCNLTNLKSLDLSSFDTSNVTSMYQMFSNIQLRELDLSNFDTRNVTNFNYMFSGTSNLETITFGPNFIHKTEATTGSMFSGCPAPERPTDESWADVSFD